jgi:thioredoxin reductase
MTDNPYDAVVIGGGPAGLQAALTLGRMHRAVLLLDSGSYRNDPATHLHNFMTRDGTPPAELRAVARGELAAYPTVEVREVAADEVKPDGDAFQVALADGTTVDARKVLLATGMRDTLPDRPGLAELFGDVVAHCPFCHGHEFAGTHVGILGAAPHAARVALMMERIAARITVFTDGDQLDDETAETLARAGAAIRPEGLTGACRSPLGARLSFSAGPDEEVGGLFVATALTQSAPFAQQLGLELLPSGGIEVDAFGRTSLPGVYAAGDCAHTAAVPMPMASVLTAAAAGLVAATSCVGDLLLLVPRLLGAGSR